MGSNVLKRRSLMVLITIAGLAFMILQVKAQGTTGIHGLVLDKNGASIPGATVVLSNPATGFTRTVVTDANGSYSFPGIQPATYRVEVAAKGFKKLVNSNAKALVDSPLELNLPMEPGDVSVVVDVTSDNIEAIINNQDASIGNNFEPKQITQLPTDRDASQTSLHCSRVLLEKVTLQVDEATRLTCFSTVSISMTSRTAAERLNSRPRKIPF